LACEGDGGFSDIAPGGQVTVKDGSGNVIGSGQLGSGTTVPLSSEESLFTLNGMNSLQECSMPIRPITLPQAAFYQISIGSRQPATDSFQQLVAGN
jgi:hypothetical protein